MELRWLYLRSTEAQQIGNLTFGPRLDSWIFKQPSFMPLWGHLQNLSMLLSKKGVPLRGMKGFFGISEVCGSELRNREEAAAELAKILQPESKAHGLAVFLFGFVQIRKLTLKKSVRNASRPAPQANKDLTARFVVGDLAKVLAKVANLWNQNPKIIWPQNSPTQVPKDEDLELVKLEPAPEAPAPQTPAAPRTPAPAPKVAKVKVKKAGSPTKHLPLFLVVLGSKCPVEATRGAMGFGWDLGGTTSGSCNVQGIRGIFFQSKPTVGFCNPWLPGRCSSAEASQRPIPSVFFGAKPSSLQLYKIIQIWIVNLLLGETLRKVTCKELQRKEDCSPVWPFSALSKKYRLSLRISARSICFAYLQTDRNGNLAARILQGSSADNLPLQEPSVSVPPTMQPFLNGANLRFIQDLQKVANWACQ